MAQNTELLVEELATFLYVRDWPSEQPRGTMQHRYGYRCMAAAIVNGEAWAIRKAWPESVAHAKAEALRELARVCFDEGDAGVIVGGIEVVETYVYDTIAALTGDEKDKANAELMREIVAKVRR